MCLKSVSLRHMDWIQFLVLFVTWSQSSVSVRWLECSVLLCIAMLVLSWLWGSEVLTVFAAVFATLSCASELEGALYHGVPCFLAVSLPLSPGFLKDFPACFGDICIFLLLPP